MLLVNVLPFALVSLAAAINSKDLTEILRDSIISLIPPAIKINSLESPLLTNSLPSPLSIKSKIILDEALQFIASSLEITSKSIALGNKRKTTILPVTTVSTEIILDETLSKLDQMLLDVLLKARSLLKSSPSKRISTSLTDVGLAIQELVLQLDLEDYEENPFESREVVESEIELIDQPRNQVVFSY